MIDAGGTLPNTIGTVGTIIGVLVGVLGAYMAAKANAREQARVRQQATADAVEAARAPLLADLADARRESDRCQQEISRHAATVLNLETRIHQLEDQLRDRGRR